MNQEGAKTVPLWKLFEDTNEGRYDSCISEFTIFLLENTKFNLLRNNHKAMYNEY